MNIHSQTLLQQCGKIAAIILFLFSLNACKKPKNTLVSSEKFKIGVDSLFINGHKIDKNISSILSDLTSGKNYMSYLSPEGIIVYSLSGNRYIEYKEIPLKSDYKSFSFYMPSLDSIYTINRGNELRLSNGDGKVIKTKIINDWIVGSNEFPMIGDSHNLYMYYFPGHPLNTREQTMKFMKRHIELAIQKADFGKTEDSIGICPVKYLNNYYYDHAPWRTEISGSKMAYSFAADNELIVYDFKNKSYSTPWMQSNFFHNNKEFDFQNGRDYRYDNKYLVENDRYGSILYDKYRNKIYRVCTHGIIYEKGDGTINEILDKSWSLIVADPEFNIEKEVVFPGGVYDTFHIYITSQGLLVKKQNDKYNDKAWVYDVFKF